MSHDLEVLPSPEAVTRRGAGYFAQVARAAVAARGRFAAAVSGGRTPRAMFERLADEDVPWERVELWQVDERIAPVGVPDRNLTGLVSALPSGAPAVRAMAVEDDDLDAAAVRYAATLPAAFDLVHLGLGEDGHTASLVPGDPVLDVADRDVALTVGAYGGRRRMTLTYRGIARARRLLWLVTGQGKASALALLLAGDPSIPAGRVRAARSLVLADEAAAMGTRP